MTSGIRLAFAVVSLAFKPLAAIVGAKLSNPVSDVRALFTEFDLYFSDGDVNRGNPEVGGKMIFQPVLPVPLYGRG